jgi:tetratricopeptide (TPR) repeat protein
VAREPHAETIGERLRRLRHERGLSQRELASPGVSYAYISRIEAGARRPSVKALRMLARKLGVSPDYLETGSEIRDVEERELRIADAELELRLAETPDEAAQKLEQLCEEALAAGDAVAAARAGVALGLAAAQAGRNTEAIERLESGLELSPLAPAARPDVFATLGRAYVASGRSDKAVDVFERCLDDLSEQEPDDVAARVRFTTYLSYALTDLGDLERAQSVLDSILDEAESLPDAYSRVRLYWSLGRLTGIQGRPAVALDYVRRAIALLDATDDTLDLGRAHLLCGTILMWQHRPEEAGPQFDLAGRLFGPHPQPEDLANLRTDQSRCAAMLGDGEAAVEHAQAALDAIGDEFQQEEKGNAVWALAEGLALTGDADAANEAFRRATVLLEQHGNRRDHVEAHRSWGKFLRRAGREDEALEVLERATDLASGPVGAEAWASR